MKRFSPSWIADTIFPATVVGYFSWWIHIHFMSDVWHGVWGYSFHEPLPYYSGKWVSGPYSLPDQFLFITLAASTMALGSLIWTMPRSAAGKLMTILALLCVFGSVTYSTTAHRKQEYFKEGTRLLIWHFEDEERRNPEDEEFFEAAKAAYDDYIRRKGE